MLTLLQLDSHMAIQLYSHTLLVLTTLHQLTVDFDCLASTAS